MSRGAIQSRSWDWRLQKEKAQEAVEGRLRSMRGERRSEGISERLHSLAEIVFVTPPALAVSRFYL